MYTPFYAGQDVHNGFAQAGTVSSRPNNGYFNSYAPALRNPARPQMITQAGLVAYARQSFTGICGLRLDTRGRFTPRIFPILGPIGAPNERRRKRKNGVGEQRNGLPNQQREGWVQGLHIFPLVVASIL